MTRARMEEAIEAGFEVLCRLDARPYRPCASGQTYRHLQPGRHAFRVQAVDMFGNADGTPAIVRFRVPRGTAATAEH